MYDLLFKFFFLLVKIKVYENQTKNKHTHTSKGPEALKHEYMELRKDRYLAPACKYEEFETFMINQNQWIQNCMQFHGKNPLNFMQCMEDKINTGFFFKFTVFSQKTTNTKSTNGHTFILRVQNQQHYRNAFYSVSYRV